MLESRWIIEKTEVTAGAGLVVTKDVLASRAGLEMLRRGGNAVDAAVAAAFAAGVVEPWMSGVGGGGFLLLHLARGGRTVAIDYSMRAPRAAHEHLYELEAGYATDLFAWRKVKGDANLHGWKSVAVPGAVAGLCYAQAHFGRLRLDEVLAPAIRLAREGFPVTWHTQLLISADARLIALYPETARTFFSDGMPRTATAGQAEVIRQPDLARTLEAIAAEGPEVFYQGWLARHIAQAMADHGGLITEEDLASYQVQVLEPPPSVQFGSDQVFSSPCPSGGPTLLETLAILAGTGVERCGHNSPAALHLIAEASRLAWADRFQYLCDPDWMPFPWQRLFAPDYAAGRRALISHQRALAEVAPGEAAALAASQESTTALVAADADRNVVAITQTLLSVFGSRVTVPATGILMNNGMYWFDPEPGKANSIGPGKRPLNNMAPLLVLREGRPFLAISSSGGRKIIGANLQVYLNAAVFGLGMQAAVSAPRIDLSTGYLLADDRLPRPTLTALEDLGHRVLSVAEAFLPRQFASPTCLRVDPESGLLSSGCDPFHPAVALGL